MPSLDLRTNVTVEDPKALCLQFSKLAAEVLGKPETYISVHLDQGKPLTFAGSFEPAFLLTIMGLGFTEERNPQIADVVFKFLKEKLNVPGDRGYIHFVDPGPHWIGYNNTTVAQFRKQ
ncbi:Tautomerase/MIF [Lentinus brumalis]|uniref:L-dopachrome isomerase n=1 Tax=Lentinus brumalis TaxID=2498619 RepID=A0A371DRN1_9APHY|nr:Tautomerase/MIF [Polyporus brumalis]